MKTFLKGLFILMLTVAVFGGGGYYTYRLYIHPELELQRDLASPHQAAPAFTDPTIAEFEKCLQIEAIGDPLASRRTFMDFIENYPDSSKAEDARTRLGLIQTGLLLSPKASPDKQITIVKSGEVMTKLCNRLKTSPELVLAMNDLDTLNLRVGQKIYSVPANFSAQINRPLSKITIYRNGDFFTQYPILGTEGSARIGAVKKGTATPVISAKVNDKPSWKEGQRVSIGEKGYREAYRWIVMQPGGHTLFAVPEDSNENIPKPPSGYIVSKDAIRELSALLRKNDTVTIK